MEASLTITQQQIPAQQVIQTMNVLQMNARELDNYINEAALENPVIDLKEEERPETERSSREQDIKRKLEWLESADRQNIVYYRDDGEDVDREANWQDIRDKGESLADHLMTQLMGRRFTPEERRSVNYIIEMLDKDGYFKDDIRSAAAFLSVSEATMQDMLLEIRKLEPAGVGASDLADCLMLQLLREEEDPVLLADTEIIIKEHLPLVAKNHLNVIAKKMKISSDRVEACCSLIRSLNPRPACCFNDRSHFHYISPDVVIVKFEDHFDIVVNEYRYPSFSISSYYEKMAEETEDREAKEYLKEKIRSARELSESIRYRISTLSRVSMLMVEKQKDFFLHGPGYKRPMQLADYADELGLHISTVSRALSNKYFQCSWGVFPMNYFLALPAASGTGSDAVTQEQIIAKIREITENEDGKKPFSDQAIADKLKETGIEISRRTVSKYRGIAGIPDKSGRKKKI